MPTEHTPLDPMYGEPDFVNAEGVKWWKTPNPGIFAVELPTGEKEYVAIHDNTIVAASPQLDAVGIKLDIHKFWLQAGTES